MIRTAKTENGNVRGLPGADPRITSFKGIPYAAPPVGENRWRAPQPAANWEGEFKAYEFSPVPMQAPVVIEEKNIYSREWSVDTDLPMGENCLTLNIWMPADGRKKMPVFFWIYGGGLQTGYTPEMEFDGERIARRGIVVVTVNYRLNVFGFLAHPEITKESPDAPANFGFLDQQAALRWVHRNIENFGGDPDNITIGGQSAGGMSVSAQMTCKENKGLFKRAIIESGTFTPPYLFEFGLCDDLAAAEEKGKEFFDFLGVKSLKEARELDEVTLRDKALQYVNMKNQWAMWGEAVDGKFSHATSQRWIHDPDRVICPVLMGHTSNEFFNGPGVSSKEELIELAKKMNVKDMDAFMSGFSEPMTRESIERDGQICAIKFAIDVIAKVNEKNPDSQPLYYYIFDTEIPGYDNPGCFHSVDLWFFFETLQKCWRPFKGKAYDLARSMCDYWCNFIKTGDPNGLNLDGEELPKWQQYSTKNRVRMAFREKAEAENCELSALENELVDTYLNNH